MKSLARILAVVAILLSVLNYSSEFAAAQSAEAIVRPEECTPVLPTEDEAIAKLRALGIPEQLVADSTPTESPFDPSIAPGIPVGRSIEGELRVQLTNSVRRWMACRLVDQFMTFVAFSSDDTLRSSVPSIAILREWVAAANVGEAGVAFNRLSGEWALWQTFGARELGPDLFGLFAIVGVNTASQGQSRWTNFAQFYVLSRNGQQFYLELDHSLNLGRSCQPEPVLDAQTSAPSLRPQTVAIGQFCDPDVA